MSDLMNDVAEQFARDRANLQMTVLRDDGLYRHVRFNGPHTVSAWFELVTWPGALAITGAHGGFTFRRCDDMFQFFRGQRVNPGQYDAQFVGASTGGAGR